MRIIWCRHWPKQDCNVTKWWKFGLCVKNIVQNTDCQPTILLIFSQVKVGKTTPTSCDRRTDCAATTARLLPGFLFYWVWPARCPYAHNAKQLAMKFITVMSTKWTWPGHKMSTSSHRVCQKATWKTYKYFKKSLRAWVAIKMTFFLNQAR